MGKFHSCNCSSAVSPWRNEIYEQEAEGNHSLLSEDGNDQEEIHAAGKHAEQNQKQRTKDSNMKFYNRMWDVAASGDKAKFTFFEKVMGYNK